MSSTLPICSAAAFEARYRRHPDPWKFATARYESDRYEAILKALRRPRRQQRYASAYEPGCSIGELTARLAPLCQRLQASDISPTAAARARRRCRRFGNVEVRCEDLRRWQPSQSVDLVIFSEIGYYFPASTLVRIAARIARQLTIGGEWIAAHWLGHSRDHVLHGDRVHRLLRASLPLRWVSGHRFAGFRIDSWVRA